MKNSNLKNRNKLTKKIKNDNKQNPIASYLKEIVYGGNDGIVTTLAVISGFAGAGGQNGSNYSVVAVLLFAFANLFADATSMGLGNFLSIRSEIAVYKKHLKTQSKQLNKNFDFKQKEAQSLLEGEGFNEIDSKKMVTLLSKNKPYWLNFMLEKELDLHDPRTHNATFTALATFTAFITFGFVPIIPYLLPIAGEYRYIYATLFAAVSLILLGTLRFKVTGEKWFKAVGEVLFIGAVSSAIAFIVGLFFK